MLHIKLSRFKVHRAANHAAKLGKGHHTAVDGQRLREVADAALHSRGDVYVSMELWGLIEEVYSDA